MKTELFIYESSAWKQVDLSEDVAFPLTYVISDIADFTKVGASRSETIKVPGTPSNDRLFRNAWNVSDTGSFEMDRKVRCYAIQEGAQVFDGWLELLSVSTVGGMERTREYECIAYSDTAGLYSSLKEYKLRGNDDPADDLDFSDYDHELTLPNVLAGFAPVIGEGVAYGLVDKHNRVAMAEIDACTFSLDELTPCLFVKEIWDRIFEKHGYSYESAFLNSDRFKRLVYPHTDRWLRMPAADVDAAYANVGDGDDECFATTNSGSAATRVTTVQNWKGSVVSQGANLSYDESTGWYTVVTPGWYRITSYFALRLSVKNPDDSPVVSIVASGERKVGCSLTLRHVKAGQTATAYAKTLQSLWVDARFSMYSTTGSVTIGSSSHDAADATVYASAGDRFCIQMVTDVYQRSTESGHAGDWLWYDVVHGSYPPIISQCNVKVVADLAPNSLGYEPSVQFSLEDRVAPGGNVHVTGILHEIKQSDFVNGIVRMFNLMIEPTGEGSFRIEPREDYYALGSVAKDWTDKLDRSRPLEISSAAELKYSPIRLTYAKDSDFYNSSYEGATKKTYGEYSYNENGSGDKYEVTLPFAPTPGGPLCATSSMQVPRIFSIDSEGRPDYSKKFLPRILYWKGWRAHKGDTILQLTDAAGVLQYTRVTQWPALGHFDDYYGADAFDLNFNACDWYWYDLAGTWATWNNLYNLYYRRQVEELQDPGTKVLRAMFRLAPKDVSELRMYDPVFVDGVYYRVSKIEGYVPGKLTKCELVSTKVQYIKFPAKHPRPVVVKPIARPPRPHLLPDYADVIISTGGNASVRKPLIADVYDANLPDFEDVRDANRTDWSSYGVPLEYSLEDVQLIDANYRFAPRQHARQDYDGSERRDDSRASGSVSGKII